MDLLIENGTVLTMNDARDVIEDGAVAVKHGRIRAVGPAPDVHEQGGRDADRTVDAAGRAVLPGFVSAHSHVSDILLRGIGNDRSLCDWLFNVKIPGTARMTAEEHAIASALFCTEAMRSGLTAFVEFGVGSDVGYGDEVLESRCVRCRGDLERVRRITSRPGSPPCDTSTSHHRTPRPLSGR